MITYQKEKFESIMGDLPKLFYDHYQEHETDKENLPLDVDWVKFVSMDARGILHIMTAREDGVLKGYMFIYLQNPAQSAKIKLAVSGQIYVAPMPNRGITLRRLIIETKKMSRDLNAKKLYNVVKAGSPAARLLQAMKWDLAEETYSCPL